MNNSHFDVYFDDAALYEATINSLTKAQTKASILKDIISFCQYRSNGGKFKVTKKSKTSRVFSSDEDYVIDFSIVLKNQLLEQEIKEAAANFINDHKLQMEVAKYLLKNSWSEKALLNVFAMDVNVDGGVNYLPQCWISFMANQFNSDQLYQNVICQFSDGTSILCTVFNKNLINLPQEKIDQITNIVLEQAGETATDVPTTEDPCIDREKVGIINNIPTIKKTNLEVEFSLTSF